jgi:hypothetical protein
MEVVMQRSTSWVSGLARAAALLLVLAAPGCDTMGKNTDGGTGGEKGSSNITPPSGVSLLAGGGSGTADFSSATQYLIAPFAYSTAAASDISFDIKVTSGGTTADSGGSSSDGSVSSSNYSLRVRRTPLEIRDPIAAKRWANRLAFEMWRRPRDEYNAAHLVLRAHKWVKTASCTLSSGCGATEVCDTSTGSCSSSVTVNVGSFSSGTITAKVANKGKHAAILVDSSDTVSSTTTEALLKKFDEVVYPRDTGLFGNPVLKSSGAQLAADRNGDGLVWLVLTSKLQAKSVVGAFMSDDFDDTNANSNKADILYVDSGLTLGEIAYATLAHEFQHLLNYATKVYLPKVNGGTGALEALWLDEGQSHFAEDACGFGGENVTLLDEKTFSSFSETALFATKDGFEMRGMAFTFVRFIFEQAGGATYNSDGTISDGGGAAMLAKMHTTSSQGTAAVAAATGSDWSALYKRWVVAIAVNGRPAPFSDTHWDFASLQTDPVTGLSSAKIGVLVRGARTDDTGKSVSLKGPLDDSITAQGTKSDTVSSSSAKFFTLSGLTGSNTVQVSSQETSFGFALIKLK